MTTPKPTDQVTMRVHVYLVGGKERQTAHKQVSHEWFRGEVRRYHEIAQRCNDSAQGAFEFVDHAGDSALIPYSRVLFIEVRTL